MVKPIESQRLWDTFRILVQLVVIDSRVAHRNIQLSRGVFFRFEADPARGHHYGGEIFAKRYTIYRIW
jgi:hypothetical protein